MQAGKILLLRKLSVKISSAVSKKSFAFVLLLLCSLSSIVFAYNTETKTPGTYSVFSKASFDELELLPLNESGFFTDNLAEDSVKAKIPESKKGKTDKYKINTNLKRNNSQEAVDSQYEDEDDADMYTPYSKWRIDKFDNWGKHKKKDAKTIEIDSNAVDTSNVKKEKEFKDNEQETHLIYPFEILQRYIKSIKPANHFTEKLSIFDKATFGNFFERAEQNRS